MFNIKYFDISPQISMNIVILVLYLYGWSTSFITYYHIDGTITVCIVMIINHYVDVFSVKYKDEWFWNSWLRYLISLGPLLIALALLPTKWVVIINILWRVFNVDKRIKQA